MAVRAKTPVLTILILAAAMALWIMDISRQAAPSAPQSGQSPGRYEVFRNCSLAENRGNDGDSFRVKLPGGRTEIIRLYFADAPEGDFKSYGGGRNNHERIAL